MNEVPDIRSLIEQAGIDPDSARITAIPGGRNNRAYLVTAGPHRFFLKQYFRHPADPRDRFASEIAFLRFCEAAEIPDVPRLRAADDARGLALLEFIDGDRLAPDTLREGDVDHALDLLSALNRREARPLASSLPHAADMRDTIQGHVELVESRVARLESIPRDGPEFERARGLIESRLQPLWISIRQRVERTALSSAIPREHWILSPSDFGFHNALRRPSGRLCFVDFEYAGWDDPSKTLADFFLQPAIPPPRTRYEDVFRVINNAAGNPPAFRERARLLHPVFGIKWCCILLNEFLPLDATRRGYAQPHVNPAERREQQLRRLSLLLDELEQETAK